MPFFDWYGGEGSRSQRKIVIKEMCRAINTASDSNINGSSLLGKGRFSRVIRCRIREESRVPLEAHINTRHKDLKMADMTDSVDNSDFSPEIAVKVSSFRYFSLLNNKRLYDRFYIYSLTLTNLMLLDNQ